MSDGLAEKILLALLFGGVLILRIFMGPMSAGM